MFIHNPHPSTRPQKFKIWTQVLTTTVHVPASYCPDKNFNYHDYKAHDISIHVYHCKVILNSLQTTTVVAQEMSFCCLMCISCATLAVVLRKSIVIHCTNSNWWSLPLIAFIYSTILLYIYRFGVNLKPKSKRIHVYFIFYCLSGNISNYDIKKT